MLLETLIACACGHPASVLEQGRSSRLPAAGPAQGSEAEGLSLASGPFVHRTPLSPSINQSAHPVPRPRPRPRRVSRLSRSSQPLSPPPPSSCPFLLSFGFLQMQLVVYSTGASPATEKRRARAGLRWFAGAKSSFELSRALVAASKQKEDGGLATKGRSGWRCILCRAACVLSFLATRRS